MSSNQLIKLTETKSNNPIYVSIDHIVYMIDVPAEAVAKGETSVQHTLVLSQGMTTPFKINERVEFILSLCEKYSNSLKLVK